jgi:uncharacterized membrane protein (UPF0127 family)
MTGNKIKLFCFLGMVCRQNYKGGLGFINLQIQNDALLVKWMETFMNKLDMPWVDLV